MKRILKISVFLFILTGVLSFLYVPSEIESHNYTQHQGDQIKSLEQQNNNSLAQIQVLKPTK